MFYSSDIKIAIFFLSESNLVIVRHVPAMISFTSLYFSSCSSISFISFKCFVYPLLFSLQSVWRLKIPVVDHDLRIFVASQLVVVSLLLWNVFKYKRLW